MAHSIEVLAGHLAENLRDFRKRRGLTQASLAKMCAVPRSTIAGIETGGGNPTLSVLSRLAAALQLPLEELLSPPRVECRVFPHGSLPVTKRGKGTLVIQKLIPHATPGMEIDRFELEEGARFTGTPHKPGTFEYLYCERGLLDLWVSGEKFALSPGDVAAFPGDQSHSYHNRGTGLAVGFSVVSFAAPSDRSRGRDGAP
jgi:transcriptional regulator with XRE-family HTH domain